MMTLVAAFVASLTACLLLTPVVRALAHRVGLVDRPDGRRKMHKRATPVAGGIALFISTCLAFVVGMAVAPESIRDEFSEQGMPFLGLLIAALVMCSVGILDDCGLLRGRHKLIGQVVAILIVIAFGVSIQRIQIFEWEIDLGLLAVPFTVFLLLGAVNSLNLLDGLDGVLGCVALIIVSAMAALAVLGNHWPAALVAAAVAGSLLGFLRYNFPPASIFLGDCGSMLIGLVVGVLAIRTSLKGPATVALAAPLAALTIPILDTTAAVVRRRLTGRSLYSSDRGHLHHCLLHQGFSIRGVLFWISFFCLFTVVGALVSVALRNELVAIVTAVAVVGILIGMRLFGYSEFILARDRLVATANSFMQFRPNGKPHATEVHLQGSVPWREIWSRFTACADDLNLKSICLDLNAPFIHENYHARWDCREEELEHPNLWFAEMPLMARGQVVGRLEIAGHRDGTPVWSKMATLTKLVEHVETTVSARAAVVNGTTNHHTPIKIAVPAKGAAHLDHASLR
jgi:UDP-GlcNAc:undecaprenyl-phosphate/decaprenyl-phosphate GlcNAc-1-phosphate transferase